jgi:hypothetical protein
MLDLNSQEYREKVLGCWMGKNCGGTLGGPLDRIYGEPEPFDISWYPKLEPEGIPNDDLELQLIWLKALEEKGIDLTAADLAQYWLDHIRYNPDEYGLNKTNLRLGLKPPVSGAYNNWFKHCMGCPIRSEIWACIAPGVPRRAVRLAYEDGICDHAGGESIYGEFFNTAMESAAFIESDYRKLIDIGRTYVPEGTATALAIDTALKAFDDGKDWKEARKQVLEATPSYNAQYSPINMGIQVIGLLYGEGFGETLCLTVNCGYDTDCTGATVGSILGIVKGINGLDEKWTEPLGYDIMVRTEGGYLVNVSDGPYPVPKEIESLTDRTIAIAKKVMVDEEVSPDDLKADESVFEILKRPVMSVVFHDPVIDVEIDYETDPVIIPDKERTFYAVLKNSHADPLQTECRLIVPDGWSAENGEQSAEVPGFGQAKLEFAVTAETGYVENSNRLTLEVSADKRPAVPSVPVVLVGARPVMVSGPYIGENLFEAELAPEEVKGDLTEEKISSPSPQSSPVKGEEGVGKKEYIKSRNGDWQLMYALDNALPEQALSEKGAVYLRYFLNAEETMPFQMGVPADVPTKVWLNGDLVINCAESRRFRPNYSGDGASYTANELQQGWNEVLIKLVIDEPPAQAHLTLCHGKELLWRGISNEVSWSKLPF